MMERMSATLDADLLRQFDAFLTARGYTNRSEALRDLIRAALVKEEWSRGGSVVAVATLVYDHHHSRLQRRLLELQHEARETIVATTHIHLDGEHCLEVLILRGPADRVRELGDRLVALPGILNGALSATGLPRGEKPAPGRVRARPRL